MKKIPTLFKRIYDNDHVIDCVNEHNDDMDWVFDGAGLATVKYDGSCTAIIDGRFYKRYDAKKGKVPPMNAIPCQEKPDPITGHWPHWIPVDINNPADKWFIQALENTKEYVNVVDGTYEAVGPHFQNNPHAFVIDILVKHGCHVIDDLDRTYDGIKKYLSEHCIEGIVFWKDGEPKCKIKRRDFGFKWPIEAADYFDIIRSDFSERK